MTPSKAMLGVLTLVLAVAIVAIAAAPLRTPPPTGLWEYKVVQGPILDLGARHKEIEAQRQNVEIMLNQLGDEGWELVLANAGFGVFKRPR